MFEKISDVLKSSASLENFGQEYLRGQNYIMKIAGQPRI
jgi:hypothetical protein